MKVQPEFNFNGFELAMQGLKVATDHAEKETPGWKEKAYSIFLEWLVNKPKGYRFLTEEFRLAAQMIGLEMPPNNKAFGFIPIKARKDKLITGIGHATCKDKKGHAHPVTQWQKV